MPVAARRPSVQGRSQHNLRSLDSRSEKKKTNFERQTQAFVTPLGKNNKSKPSKDCGVFFLE